MSTPSTGSIVGSWVVTESSEEHVSNGPPPVAHFAADGLFYQEVDIEATRFVSQPLRYAFARGKLTLFFRRGAESHLEVVEEPEGAIKARQADGQTWSMVRLAAPEPFSSPSLTPQGRSNGSTTTMCGKRRCDHPPPISPWGMWPVACRRSRCRRRGGCGRQRRAWR